MKTYLVKWFNKTRNGAWRDYCKVVETDDIKTYVSEKMHLVVGCMAYGGAKGTFRCAVEIEAANKFGYAWKEVKGGEYWFSRATRMVLGTVSWRGNYYDYKLKGWLVG